MPNSLAICNKFDIKCPCDPVTISGYILQRVENKYSNICSQMFIAAVFTIAKGENKVHQTIIG